MNYKIPSAFIIGILKFFILILLPMPTAHAQLTLIEHIQEDTQSIVTVQAQKLPPNVTLNNTNIPFLEQSGAGIIIDPAGYIVTNTHIILYADFIYVTLSSGTRLPAAIVAIAPQSDFTILKINSPTPLKPLPWSESSQITLNQDVISIGNSALWKKTICAGKITGLAKSLSTDNTGLIEMNLDLDRGDSGGPILDRQGNFLGIIMAKNTRVERSSYALPAWDIREFFLKHLKESPNSP